MYVYTRTKRSLLIPRWTKMDQDGRQASQLLVPNDKLHHQSSSAHRCHGAMWSTGNSGWEPLVKVNIWQCVKTHGIPCSSHQNMMFIPLKMVFL